MMRFSSLTPLYRGIQRFGLRWSTSSTKHKKALDSLESVFKNKLSRASAIREQHGKDEGWHESHAPDAVVFPESTDEVATIVRICAENKCPIIPFGTGTGLESGIGAIHGGVSIDLGKLNRILEVNRDDMDVRVECGVRRKQLNDYIRDTGMFFPVDPGADASLGGMCATRASGTNAVKFGTMANNVLALQVVLPNGKIINTGSRARKSSAGYDLTRFFIGSEGTLGIITQATLRIYGIPETVLGAIGSFPSVEAAVRTVISIIQLGIPVARCELLDTASIKACNTYAKLNHPEQPTIFFEVGGSEIVVKDQSQAIEEIAIQFGAKSLEWGSSVEERKRLWDARHNLLYAIKNLRPGCKPLTTDVCVPISRLAECLVATENDAIQAGILAPMLGHVGDGNFHTVVMIDESSEKEIKEATAFHQRLVHRALSMGGTCTGEHGIGMGKIEFMVKEHGQEAIDTMMQLKRALDPHNIMNPGKVLPWP